ncbi:MAG: site-2 protease family protein [Clostridia bacterium]|nr:site-2 protease family protein [Clostridia bacterium]
MTVFVLCLSLSFHEFSHAWVANRLGDDTAALQGRLTLNPLRHLDPVGSLLFLIGGIGWARPVPVNPARFSRNVTMKSGMMRVSLAGPVSNLVLATVSCILYFIVLTILQITQDTGSIAVFFLKLTVQMYSSNLVLAVFNLLPVPPLDGSKVFGSLLPNSVYYKVMQYERYIGMAFLVLVLFGRGFLGTLLGYVRIPFDYVIFKPINFLFEQLWKLL